MPFQLLALVLPAGLDAFAVAAALAAAGLGPAEKRRVMLTFPAFEAGMPVLGFLAGAALEGPLGSAADFLAATVLGGVGVWLTLEGSEEAAQARRLARAHGLPLLLLGAAIGVDELGIGVGAGLRGQSPLAVLALIATFAILATPLGLAVGSRARRLNPVAIERLAGAILISLALVVAIESVF